MKRQERQRRIKKQRVDAVGFCSVLCSWRCRDEKNKIWIRTETVCDCLLSASYLYVWTGLYHSVFLVKSKNKQVALTPPPTHTDRLFDTVRTGAVKSSVVWLHTGDDCDANLFGKLYRSCSACFLFNLAVMIPQYCWVVIQTWWVWIKYILPPAAADCTKSRRKHLYGGFNRNTLTGVIFFLSEIQFQPGFIFHLRWVHTSCHSAPIRGPQCEPRV